MIILTHGFENATSLADTRIGERKQKETTFECRAVQ